MSNLNGEGIKDSDIKVDGTIPTSLETDVAQNSIVRGSLVSRVGRWKLAFLVVGTLAVVALISWPYGARLMASVSAPDVVKDVGTVQKINFVGGLHITTQVEVETEALLIDDAANLPKGTRLQLRENFFGRQVCISGSRRCWDLVGR